MSKSLDIPERQVLISFWDDPNGLVYHARILLFATPSPGKWIVGAPDFDVQFADLSEHRVTPLGRDEDLPRRYLARTYAFDVPIEADQLARMRRAGRDLLEVFGLTGAAGAVPQGGRWRVADLAHEAFGDEIPEGVIGDGQQMAIRDSMALVCIDEAWAAAELVEEADLAEWKRLKATGPGRDPRLLGDERVGGQPHMTFQTVAKLSKSANRPAWPFNGKPAGTELQRALMTANHDYMSHHLDWRSKSGVRTHGVVCRFHRRICEALAQFVSYDQLDPANVAGIEYLSRWLFEIETAVRRSPKVPDFDNLEGIFAAPLGEDGRALLPEFGSFVSGLQRDEAQRLKQMRLWHEETGHLNQGGGGRGSGGGADESGRGRGRGRGGRGRGRGAEAAPEGG